MMKRPLCFMCLIFLTIQSVFLIVTSGHEIQMPASSIFHVEDGKEVLVVGQVYKKRSTSNTEIYYLKNNSITYQDKSYYDSNLILYNSRFSNVPIGKNIVCKGTISQFDIAHNPGNFDQTLYYAKEGIYGTIMCKNIIEISGKTSEVQERLYLLKLRWKEMLTETIGEENGAILSAMLLGEKSEMDVDVKELYQKNGIGHILAISGLHISFIGLGFYRSIRKIGLPYGVSGVIAVGILYLYASMIGFSISVFRAFVMLLLKIGADMSGRIYDMPTALMLSAAITIAHQPLYLTDAAFYLSYGAILGIILVLPALEKCFGGKQKLLAASFSGIAVNLTLFPIQLWYYYEFPMYSIIINLIVIPLMSVLLGAGMFGSILCALWKPVGVLVLQPCDWILKFFHWLSDWGMKLPYARAVIGQPKLGEIIIYYVILSVILYWIYRRKEKWKYEKWCWLSLFVGVFFLVYRPSGTVQITMLDVGQGDGIFLKGPTGITYFIDGGSSDVSELGKYRIEPYLKSQGINALDYVFISHGDTDHYSGISEMLLRQNVGIRIRTLVLPENYKEDEALLQLRFIAEHAGTTVKIMKENDCVREEALEILCIQSGKGLTGNAGSMVLELEYGKFQMLFTGDVEAEGEEQLIERWKRKDYDILKVAHHGSKNSTADTFLEKTNPEIALISAGKDNSYGHPHEEVLKRLRARNINIFQTVEDGAITVMTDGNEMRLLVFH